VDLLREIRPGLRRLANLGDVPPGGNSTASDSHVAQAARAAGLQFRHFGVERADAITATFDEMLRWRADAVVVSATPVLVSRKREVMDHAARMRLPAIYARSDIVAEGGLMSYSADFADNYRKAAGYVDRILKGAKPAELPVQQPTKFFLVVNLKTARALGIALPRELLLRVDELIQ
jgi:putative ABC transport system substrate-binding protein